jgi:ABC-type microcin C transport system permease subunit YejB
MKINNYEELKKYQDELENAKKTLKIKAEKEIFNYILSNYESNAEIDSNEIKNILKKYGFRKKTIVKTKTKAKSKSTAEQEELNAITN